VRDTWIAILADAARCGRTLDLMAEVLNDDGSAAFHPPLGLLLRDRLGPANALRANGMGSRPPERRAGPGPRDVGGSFEEPGDEPVGSLEPITSVTAGLQNPRAAVQALLAAMPRTAMIEVAGRPRGKLEDWNVPSEHLNFARLELAPVPEGPDGVGRGAYQLDATTYTTSRPARCCSSCGWGGLSAS
jgi:hypothetical protein